MKLSDGREITVLPETMATEFEALSVCGGDDSKLALAKFAARTLLDGKKWDLAQAQNLKSNDAYTLINAVAEFDENFTAGGGKQNAQEEPPSER
jgi:hypothetical protein